MKVKLIDKLGFEKEYALPEPLPPYVVLPTTRVPQGFFESLDPPPLDIVSVRFNRRGTDKNGTPTYHEEWTTATASKSQKELAQEIALQKQQQYQQQYQQYISHDQQLDYWKQIQNQQYPYGQTKWPWDNNLSNASNEAKPQDDPKPTKPQDDPKPPSIPLVRRMKRLLQKDETKASRGD